MSSKDSESYMQHRSEGLQLGPAEYKMSSFSNLELGGLLAASPNSSKPLQTSIQILPFISAIFLKALFVAWVNFGMSRAEDFVCAAVLDLVEKKF